MNQGASAFLKKGGWGYFGFLVLGTWGLGPSGFGLVDKAGDVDKQVALYIYIYIYLETTSSSVYIYNIYIYIYIYICIIVHTHAWTLKP